MKIVSESFPSHFYERSGVIVKLFYYAKPTVSKSIMVKHDALKGFRRQYILFTMYLTYTKIDVEWTVVTGNVMLLCDKGAAFLVSNTWNFISCSWKSQKNLSGQDCGHLIRPYSAMYIHNRSSALSMEIPRSCAKPSKCSRPIYHPWSCCTNMCWAALSYWVKMLFLRRNILNVQSRSCPYACKPLI